MGKRFLRLLVVPVLFFMGCVQAVPAGGALEKKDAYYFAEPIIDTAQIIIDESPTATPTATPSATPIETIDATPTPEVVVESEYVEETPVQETYSESNNGGYSGKAYGSAGRLRIPAVGIDVGLNYTECYGSYEQQMACQGVVDAWDSAGYFSYGGEMVIADHNGQGFSGIIGLPVGTEVDIDNPDGSTSAYTVVSSYASYNGDTSLGIWHNGSIALYTCVSGWQDIWVVEIQ